MFKYGIFFLHFHQPILKIFYNTYIFKHYIIILIYYNLKTILTGKNKYF